MTEQLYESTVSLTWRFRKTSAHRRRCKNLPPIVEAAENSQRLVARALADKGITACPRAVPREWRAAFEILPGADTDERHVWPVAGTEAGWKIGAAYETWWS